MGTARHRHVRRPPQHRVAYLQYLSGRDLAGVLSKGTKQIHGWRVQMLAIPGTPAAEAEADAR